MLILVLKKANLVEKGILISVNDWVIYDIR